METQQPQADLELRASVHAVLDAIDRLLGNGDALSREPLGNLPVIEAGVVQALDENFGARASHAPSLSARVLMSIRRRKTTCLAGRYQDTDYPMPGKKFTFREALEAACRSHPELWHSDPSEIGMGVLNVGAVVRHYQRKGYTVTQPNLHRILKGDQEPGPKVIAATEGAFGIPRAILRGEPLSEQMERLLGKASLETLLLAERIGALDADDHRQLVELLALLEDKREKLQKAIAESGNVHVLPRRTTP